MFEKRRIEDNKAFKSLAYSDLTKIAAEANKTNQIELAERIHELMNQLEQSAVTDSKELPLFYVAVRRYCLDIQDDLTARNYKTALVRMKEFEAMVKDLVDVAERNKISLSGREQKVNARVESRLEKYAKKTKIKISKNYSPKEINVETLYGNETIGELRISGLQDRLDRANAELEKLRNSGTYGSALTKSQIQSKKQEIGVLKELVQIANNTMFREHQAELIQNATAEIKAEYAYQTKKFNAQQEEIFAEWEAIKAKHGLSGASDEQILASGGQVDAEEKFYELMNDFKHIKEDIKVNNKEINSILRKIKDLAEDMETARGSEKDEIADEIRDLKASYQERAQKKKLLEQKKADVQAAYQVIARDRNFEQVKEKYAGVDKETINLIREVAGNYSEKIEEANADHAELADISAVALGAEIETDSYADVDVSKSGSGTEDLEDIINLAKEQAD